MACFLNDLITVTVINVFTNPGCSSHTVEILSDAPGSGTWSYTTNDGCVQGGDGDFITVDATGLFVLPCFGSYNGHVHASYSTFNFFFTDVANSYCGHIELWWDNGGTPDPSKRMIIESVPSPSGHAPPFAYMCGGLDSASDSTPQSNNHHQRRFTGPTNVTISHGVPLNNFTTTKGIGMRRKPILAAALEAGRECVTWAFVGPDIISAVNTRDCSL